MRPTLFACNNVSVLVQLASFCCAGETTQVFTTALKVHGRSGKHESESKINFRQKNSAGNLKIFLQSRVVDLCSLFDTYIRFSFKKYVLCKVWLDIVLCTRRFLKLVIIIYYLKRINFTTFEHFLFLDLENI